jgi:hypothetical protein
MLETGSSLKRRLLDEKAPDEALGFQFPKPTELHVRPMGSGDSAEAAANRFHTALKQQKEGLALIDAADVLSGLDLDGRVADTDFRFTKAAFGDLCHISRGTGRTGLPTVWLKQLAKRNDALALQIVQEHIDAHIPGAERQLVVDTEHGHVLGLVGKNSYHLVHNFDIFDWAMSSRGFKFSNGWLSGGRMRLTCLRDNFVIEPQKGDVVRVGMNCENAINGESRFNITDYCERLVCTNGMVSRQGAHTTSLRHTSPNLHELVPDAILAASTRSESMKPLIDVSAKVMLDEDGHRRIGRYIENPNNGGSPKLLSAATTVAVQYARMMGRDEDDISIWDYVNGVTETAHTAPSLKRRTDIETLGFKVLERFATPHLNSVSLN